MWADLINKDKVHRALWCALYMAVTLLLQNTVFAHIALFGVHAMFVPAVVVAVGVFEGGTWGAVLGLIAGYFCAMGYPGTGMLFAVLFAVIGFGALQVLPPSRHRFARNLSAVYDSTAVL